LQISFRSLVPDATFWMPLNDEAAYRDAFATACQRLSFQLRPRLELASKADLLTFVVNYLVPQRNPIGILHRRFDFRNPEHFVQRLNEFLEEYVRGFANAYVLDVDRLAASIGRRFVQDDALAIFAHNTTWPTWGMITDRIEPVPPLSEFYDVRHLDLFQDLVWAELQTMFRVAQQADVVKLVAIDLDDILWHGVSGEMETISPEMLEGWPLGLAEALMYLKNRGVLLAIISKNEDARVRSLWDRMFVGRMQLSDFAVVKINWTPKTENMAAILRETNLLPRNVVFIDDNPAERKAMSLAYPDMRILGKHIYYLRRILLWSAETQSAGLTEESMRRTRMIQQQVVRDVDRKSLSRPEFLAQAGLKVSVSQIETASDPRFPRAHELINRTNQFNTTGQRWTASALTEFLESGGTIFVFEAIDRYTAYGLVGVVLTEGATIRQWVMSCRVLGLDVEQFVMRRIVQTLRSRGADTIVASLLETDANFPCRDLFAKTGFTAEQDGSMWKLRDEVIGDDDHIQDVS